MKKIINFALIFLLLNPINIYAKDIYKLYHFENIGEKITFKNYEFLGNFTEEEKLFYLIKQIFNVNNENVKGVFIEKGNLYVNFNENIADMPKGSYGEISVIRMALHTIFQFKEIKTVTFLQDGNHFIMPAGSHIYKHTRDNLKEIDEIFSE